ncbi:hypothetical protein BaRGS_00025419 [Batillaria attramentaria]|uniref:Uncharacterized protein n=1 Tax=Batillaria attramentaria TaxID=370345 RepID=A0ABD0K8F7_9CAEN
MPSTRSATVKSDDNTIEEIKKTKCPIQVNFKAGLNRVHYWRQVLYKRYVQTDLPWKVACDWRDDDSRHKPINAPILLPYPPELHSTLIHLRDDAGEQVTITVFYTSSTVRAQGFGYQVWIDEEFETLKTLADDLIASNPNVTLPTSNLAVPPSSTADEILTNNTGTVETDGSYHAPTREETIRANSGTATGGTALVRETRVHNSLPSTPTFNTTSASHDGVPPHQATRKLGATEGISAKRDLGGEDASSGEVTDTGKTPVGQGAVRENDEAVNHTQALYSDAAPRATVTPASFAILADSAAHKLIFLMQQQLAESTTTISSLRIELSKVNKELPGFKAECATLRKDQEKMASLISDNEVKAKNQKKASKKCLVDTMQATATTLTKD